MLAAKESGHGDIAGLFGATGSSRSLRLKCRLRGLRFGSTKSRTNHCKSYSNVIVRIFAFFFFNHFIPGH